MKARQFSDHFSLLKINACPSALNHSQVKWKKNFYKQGHWKLLNYTNFGMVETVLTLAKIMYGKSISHTFLWGRWEQILY